MLLGEKTVKTEPAATQEDKGRLRMPALLMIAGIMYNAVLAFLHAQGLPVNEGVVALAEFLILLAGSVYLPFHKSNLVHTSQHLFFYVAIACLCGIVFMFNATISVKFLRDMYLMVLFIILGSQCEEKELFKAFKVVTLLTLAVMAIEIFSTDLYVSLLAPASYYEVTRGVATYGSTGLFRGAIVSDSRFSFGLLNIPRLSSLFLEQVSLANFSMILTLFLITFWGKLGKFDRLFYLFSILLIVVGNNTRTGTAVNLLLFIGYWVFPKLPRRGNALIMPAILLIAALFFYDPHITARSWSDDLNGRIGLTLSLLAQLDIGTLVGGNLGPFLDKTHDSGYVYIICFSTVFGLFLYWLYTSFFLRPFDAKSRRFLYGCSLFLATNLLISAAIFTIKISAPLWMMAGFLCRESILARQREKWNGSEITSPF